MARQPLDTRVIVNLLQMLENLNRLEPKIVQRHDLRLLFLNDYIPEPRERCWGKDFVIVLIRRVVSTAPDFPRTYDTIAVNNEPIRAARHLGARLAALGSRKVLIML